jgi:hypothetical protein
MNHRWADTIAPSPHQVSLVYKKVGDRLRCLLRTRGPRLGIPDRTLGEGGVPQTLNHESGGQIVVKVEVALRAY